RQLSARDPLEDRVAPDSFAERAVFGERPTELIEATIVEALAEPGQRISDRVSIRHRCTSRHNLLTPIGNHSRPDAGRPAPSQPKEGSRAHVAQVEAHRVAARDRATGAQPAYGAHG